MIKPGLIKFDPGYVVLRIEIMNLTILVENKKKFEKSKDFAAQVPLSQDRE